MDVVATQINRSMIRVSSAVTKSPCGACARVTWLSSDQRKLDVRFVIWSASPRRVQG